MPLKLRRIILFTSNMNAMSAFYGDALGLPLVTDEDGFKEFDAGGCRIALHNGASEVAPARRSSSSIRTMWRRCAKC